jgi:endoglucanase
MVVYDQALSWRLIDAAAAAGVPAQHGVYAGYASDGVPFTQAGIASALVGIPTRYTHTAFELVDPVDIDATVATLNAFLTAD